MQERLEITLTAISAAFAERCLPNGDSVFTARSPELDSEKLAELARQCRWPDVPWDALCANSIALAFATPAAFAYFLPACMTASLKRYGECGALTSMLLTCLTPADDSDAVTMAALERDFEALEPGFLRESAPSDGIGADEETEEEFARRIAPLTVAERAAVREYLKYLDDVHGHDFPVFGPGEALERFWADA